MAHSQTRSLFAVLALVIDSVALPVLPALAANKIYISEIAYAGRSALSPAVAPSKTPPTFARSPTPSWVIPGLSP